MKYFGTYNNDSDLVPKSYVDNLLYSHIESPINVARRVIFNSSNYIWDNCYSEISYNSDYYSEYVAISINPDYKFTSYYFTYNPILGSVGFPQTVEEIKAELTNNRIYYVLQLSSDLHPGKDLFVNLRSDSSEDFDITVRGIRVLIPEIFYFKIEGNGVEEDQIVYYPVYYNGRHNVEGGNNAGYLRNGYVDIGCSNFDDPDGYFLSATFHIYSDGECYYVNSCPLQRGAV